MQLFEFLLPIFTDYGYVAVFVMLLICGFGVPVPEDVTLAVGGVIAGLGYANPHVMFAVGMAGVMTGDGIMFGLGRWYGDAATRSPLFRRVLTPERFVRAQGAFERYGSKVMFVARFLPGLRTPVFFTAGMTGKVKFRTWFVMDGLAALISVPVCVYLGYHGAQNRDWLFATIEQFQHGIFALLGVGAIALWVWWRKTKRLQGK